MERRTFFTKLIVAVAAGTVASAAKAIPNMENIKELRYNVPNRIVSDTVVKMPSNPSHGDMVHVIVDSSSLSNPCLLICNHSSITGDREPLVLDQLATIVFKYDAFKKDWVL